MSEFKGSKPPWKVVPTIDQYLGVRCDGYYICSLHKPIHYLNQDDRYEQEMERYNADQHIIAAAPELLEALIALSDKTFDDQYLARTKEMQAVYDKCVSVVNKALGKEVAP